MRANTVLHWDVARSASAMTTMPAIVEAMLRVASSAMDLYCS
mgnify:CR=1 FL=1